MFAHVAAKRFRRNDELICLSIDVSVGVVQQRRVRREL
jgi:hypothetical protein